MMTSGVCARCFGWVGEGDALPCTQCFGVSRRARPSEIIDEAWRMRAERDAALAHAEELTRALTTLRADLDLAQLRLSRSERDAADLGAETAADARRLAVAAVELRALRTAVHELFAAEDDAAQTAGRHLRYHAAWDALRALAGWATRSPAAAPVCPACDGDGVLRDDGEIYGDLGPRPCGLCRKALPLEHHAQCDGSCDGTCEW